MYLRGKKYWTGEGKWTSDGKSIGLGKVNGPKMEKVLDWRR